MCETHVAILHNLLGPGPWPSAQTHVVPGFHWVYEYGERIKVYDNEEDDPMFSAPKPAASSGVDDDDGMDIFGAIMGNPFDTEFDDTYDSHDEDDDYQREPSPLDPGQENAVKALILAAENGDDSAWQKIKLMLRGAHGKKREKSSMKEERQYENDASRHTKQARHANDYAEADCSRNELEAIEKSKAEELRWEAEAHHPPLPWTLHIVILLPVPLSLVLSPCLENPKSTLGWKVILSVSTETYLVEDTTMSMTLSVPTMTLPVKDSAKMMTLPISMKTIPVARSSWAAITAKLRGLESHLTPLVAGPLSSAMKPGNNVSRPPPECLRMAHWPALDIEGIDCTEEPMDWVQRYSEHGVLAAHRLRPNQRKGVQYHMYLLFKDMAKHNSCLQILAGSLVNNQVESFQYKNDLVNCLGVMEVQYMQEAYVNAHSMAEVKELLAAVSGSDRSRPWSTAKSPMTSVEFDTEWLSRRLYRYPTQFQLEYLANHWGHNELRHLPDREVGNH
ncbi:hypothetical protein BS47DRAFT_1357641 [Hydnum rufescens UP504]|uniref:Uncharacterized protein n=1 Tax=Hydnum rufescens UP504 TaxID=1448309 RepID=A0A9P6B9B3_9AGAM|nr:hypothetical protein BS47DRAFT_1357641 [Hydnum rufescens UP504]